MEFITTQRSLIRFIRGAEQEKANPIEVLIFAMPWLLSRTPNVNVHAFRFACQVASILPGFGVGGGNCYIFFSFFVLV